MDGGSAGAIGSANVGLMLAAARIQRREGKPMHELKTPRLHLRPIREGDASLYCRLYTDPEVMRHVAAPLSAEAAQRAFAAVLRKARQAAPPLRVWVLVERELRTEVGILAMIRDADAADSMELGTMLIAEGQGRGLAAEAQAALLARLFSDVPRLRMVWSRHAPANAAVVGLKLKLGFIRVESSGEEVRWQLTHERWLALRTETAVARAAEVG